MTFLQFKISSICWIPFRQSKDSDFLNNSYQVVCVGRYKIDNMQQWSKQQCTNTCTFYQYIELILHNHAGQTITKGVYYSNIQNNANAFPWPARSIKLFHRHSHIVSGSLHILIFCEVDSCSTSLFLLKSFPQRLHTSIYVGVFRACHMMVSS